MNGLDGSATIVRLALEQREPHGPGRVNSKGDRMLAGTDLALA
ncbi:hypothetical protein DES45_11452 [Microvirga subterranea]|uniref:Uncharacterized protein n=1 Tax=Microvirga subterranea TaxID=186651 RepID=A0A370H7F2_9HYPH|nr:hypothetical protein DES45_11452 [Microvirga subterranea]